MVRDLVYKGADIDAKMGLPATKLPIDIAKDFGHEDIVPLLT